MKCQFTAGFADDKKRLDVFLSEKIEGLTRSQAKKQVESGLFFVNNKAVSGHHFLKEGDTVEEQAPETTKETHRANESNAREDETVSLSEKELHIIKECAEWIVVYKPCGVLMHPDHSHPKGTLIDALIERYPEIAKVGEDPVRPGIMSRLDKDVSGLVIIARTQDAFDHLKKQFAEHSVEKHYTALVYGELEDEEGDIRFRIGRSQTKARMAAMPEGSEKGQAAWTHYIVVKRYADATLLDLQILTGRTHQIRAHLFALQHPIVGDRLYKPKSVIRHIPSTRLLLQSTSLAFIDPVTEERLSVSLPLDQDFQQMIDKLKTDHT